jgi:hypothetical protein
MIQGLPTRLLGKRQGPFRPVTVRIVDDQPELARGMAEVLRGWPRMKTEIVIYDGLHEPVIPPNTDVLLLDDLDEMLYPVHVTGAKFAEKLLRRGFPGVIVSTALRSSNGPSFARFAFTGKSRLAYAGLWSAADELITVVNEALLHIPRKNPKRP